MKTIQYLSFSRDHRYVQDSDHSSSETLSKGFLVFEMRFDAHDQY